MSVASPVLNITIDDLIMVSILSGIVSALCIELFWFSCDSVKDLINYIRKYKTGNHHD